MHLQHLLVSLLLTVVAASPARPAIHGGTDAEPGEFPSIVSIRRIANAFKHMCAGVLVAPEWVLTSAFCVGEVGPSSIDAVGGEHNLVVPSLHEQVRGVEAIARHPNYTHSDSSMGGMATPETNDIALLRLKSAMEETEWVGVAELAGAEPAPGTECVTAGWGTRTTGGLFMTSILQRAAAKPVARPDCEQVRKCDQH